MFQRADRTWQYAPEDRLLLHESAHALVDLILTGTTSRVTIAQGYTGGVCRKVWNPDVARASGLDDAAYYCWGLHSAVAGIAGVKSITWGKALVVVKSWLRTYDRAWRAGARALSVGTYTPSQMEAAFLRSDGTGHLRQYTRAPFLSDTNWLAQWEKAYREVVN
jgi:hypothetical protein